MDGFLDRAKTLPKADLPLFIGELEAAWAQDPSSELLLPLGLSLWRLESYAKARDVLDQLPDKERIDPVYLTLRGMVLRRLPKCEQEAEQCLRLAIDQAPDRSDGYYNLANLLLDRDEFIQAESNYLQCLCRDNSASLAWHNLGIARNGQQQFESATPVLQTSLQLDPCSADAWCNLGLSFFGAGRFAPARRAFAVAISLDSQHGASHVNMGNALMGLLEPEQALCFLEKGVQLEQSSSNSLWNLSLAYLLTGDFKRGWEYYEARFATANFTDDIRPSCGQQPRSLQECSRDASAPLLVWTEQGVGDAIQFGRYLTMLQAADVEFLFMTRKPLLRLFRDWFGLGDRVLEQPPNTIETDHRQQIPLLSLPKLFGTELATIPSITPYLTPKSCPPDDLRVTAPPAGISIGLVWATNPQNKAMYRNKSCPLHLLMPRLHQLMDLDLIDLHSLQVGSDASQLDPWKGHPRLSDWSARLNDFSDTAHVIQQLDLVISVDTAVAHLAGALHRPTWLLLPCNADFRWLRERSDSPWYPTMRLFRQPSHLDWSAVSEHVNAALDQLFMFHLDKLSLSAA